MAVTRNALSLVLLIVLATVPGAILAEDVTLLIENAILVDGSGAPPRVAAARPHKRVLSRRLQVT